MLEALADQPRAAQLLTRALESDRVAHAYAFIGPPGSGRTSAAKAFAAALVCAKGGCGACRDCRLAATGQHPDVHLIVPTPPPSNPKGTPLIRLDQIHELERKASLRPLMAARKVFIIDDAERMTPDSPQAFLKTLEEPPARTVIIIVLPTARALPATILSRCQRVRFVPHDDGAAAESVTAVLALLEEVRAGGGEVLLRRSQRIERAKAEALVDGLWRLARDLLLAASGAPATLLTAPDRGAAIVRESARWTTDELLGVIRLCREARDGLLRNVSPGLTMEVLLSRVALRAA
ncbi:MAG: AAA family ATPase [Candidatus Rokubacteria bacterium]|nr:AAA family ATPase [Candidatus Rokubacteria bacterium]